MYNKNVTHRSTDEKHRDPTHKWGLANQGAKNHSEHPLKLNEKRVSITGKGVVKLYHCIFVQSFLCED